MKKCPFCAELIQEEAVKCRYCGEFFNQAFNPKVSGLHGTPSTGVKLPVLLLAMVCLGPLAPLLLPILWRNPVLSRKTKIIITVLSVLFAAAIIVALTWAMGNVAKYYQQVFSF